MTSLKPVTKKSKKSVFDKYDLYTHSVQSADHDASLIRSMYHAENPGQSSQELLIREDFCGSGELCFEWTRLDPTYRALGVDIDNSALAWGLRKHDVSRERSTTEKRVKLVCGDVFRVDQGRPNIICALNFSYYFILHRDNLLRYFKLCRKRLAKNGMLILDAFGGPDYLVPHLDKRRNPEKKFTFWWEVESFDAITHRIKTHIHFQIDGQRIKKRVFSYDWRLWTLPEISDALVESGFKQIEFWAEGLDSHGLGNGRFRKIKTEQNCETWVTYITARF